MIFGCDVNKPSPTDKSRNRKEAVETTESIAAVTGSIDPNYAYYAARIIAQKKAKKDSIECIYDLKYPVKELLELYKTKNRKFPERLIFFRDGISEGEFRKVCKIKFKFIYYPLPYLLYIYIYIYMTYSINFQSVGVISIYMCVCIHTSPTPGHSYMCIYMN